MKGTVEIVENIYASLDGSPLESAITGELCKFRRTPNSNKEDVVINCLPTTNGQLQEAIANVNIHVPDITINKNGAVDYQPNLPRLKALCDLALAALTDKWEADYNFDVQQQTLIQDNEAKDHYINIRLEFYNVNI